MYNLIMIGVDQSYARTGISVAADGQLLMVRSIDFKCLKTKSDKRKLLKEVLHKLICNMLLKAKRVVVICERVRTFSGGFLSTAYIQATGALIAVIVDTAYEFNIQVFSADTRAWKSQVVGTTKAKNGNKKLPTIEFIISRGFKDSICSLNKKNVIVYDDDAADSGCIALYGFIKKGIRKLKLEK